MQSCADPRRWYTTNLVGIPAALLGSTVLGGENEVLTIGGDYAVESSYAC